MKKTTLFLLLLLLLAGFTSIAQDEKEPPVTLIKTEGSGFTYEKVIDLPSVSKGEAYDRIKQWVASNLKTVDNNILFDDKDKNQIATSTNLLLGKVLSDITLNVVEFKISFSFKDNKMKISASQFMYSGHDERGNSAICEFDKIKGIDYGNKARRIIYEKFDEKFKALIDSAEAAAMKKDDKW